MSSTKPQSKPRTRAPSAPLRRGRIVAIPGTGRVVVRIGRGRSSRDVSCDVLQSAQQPALELAVGDAVVVMMPERKADPGCVLGRSGPYRKPDREVLTIEALRELVLKCGEATITLRHDGKLLIRADDIATVARRRNRIKGGSVDIN